MMLLAGMADIPQTRLYGRAPAGMNATGDSDARNYAMMVKARQELKLQPAMASLDEAIIRSALGVTLDSAHWYVWRPLYGTTESEAATIEKTFADGLVARVNTGAFSTDMLAKAELNRMIESGRYPGIEDAADAAAAEGGIIDPDEAAEEAAMQVEAEAAALAAAGGNRPRLVSSQDAQPRTLYVRRDVVNAAEITAWAVAQGLTDILTDLHVTIVYSRTPIDWMKAGNGWDGDDKGQITIPPGGPRVVEPLGGITAALLFASTTLQWRHESVIREAGASHDFAEYVPHISLTKAEADLSTVEPYRGKIVLGPEIFEEVKP